MITGMRKHLEDDECMALIEWRDKVGVTVHAELELLIHIPNGGKRNAREGARFKRMGVKAGVSDYFLPVARQGFHGLWIEMKAPTTTTTSTNQARWLTDMTSMGYLTGVCHGWVEAKDFLLGYLGGASYAGKLKT